MGRLQQVPRPGDLRRRDGLGGKAELPKAWTRRSGPWTHIAAWLDENRPASVEKPKRQVRRKRRDDWKSVSGDRRVDRQVYAVAEVLIGSEYLRLLQLGGTWPGSVRSGRGTGVSSSGTKPPIVVLPVGMLGSTSTTNWRKAYPCRPGRPPQGFSSRIGVRRSTMFDVFVDGWEPGMEWRRVEVFGDDRRLTKREDK